MAAGHPNIIYMKEYFEENGRVYVVMEFLAGGELLEALLNKEKGEDGTCRVGAVLVDEATSRARLGPPQLARTQ